MISGQAPSHLASYHRLHFFLFIDALTTETEMALDPNEPNKAPVAGLASTGATS